MDVRLPLILLVDDDSDFCTIVTNNLSDIGEFISTSDLHGAVQHLENSSPALMLLDNYLPDGLGAQFVSHCRTSFPDTKIIMVSADNDAELKRQTLEAGAALFFVKPFDMKELREGVRKVLATGKPSIDL